MAMCTFLTTTWDIRTFTEALLENIRRWCNKKNDATFRSRLLSSSCLMSFLRGLKRQTENCFTMLLDPFSWTNNHCVCSKFWPGTVCEESHRVATKRTPNDQWNSLQRRKTLLSIGWWHENIAGALFVSDISLNHDPRVRQRRNPHGEGFSVYVSYENDSRVSIESGLYLENTLSISYEKELHFLPRPFLSKLMLLYPPPPMLSSSRSRHSIVVLNSYDDDPNIFQCQTWLTSESFNDLRAPF